MTTVRVSARSMRQVFHGCEPDYIANVCKGACCRSSTSPTGTRIALLPAEAARFVARGLPVVDGRLEPLAGARRCPYQGPANLCGLHDTPDKPFGCIASPFMLTTRDTLVVRNRYRLLRCYRDGTQLAYQAFGTSLQLLFGPTEAARITAHLDAGGDDLTADMLPTSYGHLATLHGRPLPPDQLTLKEG